MQITNDEFSLHKSTLITVLALAFSWLIGVLFAIYLFRHCESFLFLLVRRSFGCSMSTVDRIAVSSFPLIIAVVAALYHKAGLFYLLFGFKSFQYSFCTFAVYSAFGDAGWLAQLLIMFSDSFITVIMVVFGLHCILHKHYRSHKPIMVFVLLCAITLMLDAAYIAPMVPLLGI